MPAVESCGARKYKIGEIHDIVLWIARFNASEDITQLRLNIGDNTNTDTYCPSDQFVVGVTNGSGTWEPKMAVSATQVCGTTTTTSTVKVYGDLAADKAVLGGYAGTGTLPTAAVKTPL